MRMRLNITLMCRSVTSKTDAYIAVMIYLPAMQALIFSWMVAMMASSKLQSSKEIKKTEPAPKPSSHAYLHPSSRYQDQENSLDTSV